MGYEANRFIYLAGFLLVIGGYFLATELIFSDTKKTLTAEEENDTDAEAGNGGVSPYTNLEKVASAKLGTEVHIPFHPDIPLRTAFIFDDGYSLDDEEFVGDPVAASFVYSTLKADEEEEKSEELAMRYPPDLIYGEFLLDDKHMVALNILNGETNHIDVINKSLMGEEKSIAGKTVYYSYRKNSTPETFRISFRVNEDVYAFYFNTERVTENYGYAFVEKSLKQIEE